MPGRHTAKQKRQAKHIADSERKRGVDPKRAESIGWATVNKMAKGPEYALSPGEKPPKVTSSTTAGDPFGPRQGIPEALRMTPKTQSYAPVVQGVQGSWKPGEAGKTRASGPRTAVIEDAAPAKDMPKVPNQSTMPAPKPQMVASAGPASTIGPRGRNMTPSTPKAPMLAQKAILDLDEEHRRLTEKLRRRARGGGKRAARRAQLAAFGKGGETTAPGVRSRNGATGTISGAAVARTLHDARTAHPAGKDVTRFGITTVASKPSSLSHKDRERLRQKRMDRMAGKSLKVMSIADYYDSVVKADGPSAPAPGAGTGAPKRFPRKEKPTVQLKPVGTTKHQRTGAAVQMRAIGDGEAMANLKAGKHIEKAMVMLQAIKALVAGYGKVSGAGALRAANRGSLSVEDLQRAMEVMPKPAGVKPPSTYLPGVHDPKSPMRNRKGKSAPKAKTEGGSHAMTALKEALGSTAKCMDADSSSMEPDLKKQKTTKSLGESMVDDGWQPVVHKSEGDTEMSKTNFNDLFKSELGIANDEPLIDCPHCEAPITKSDLSKASVAKQNASGKTMHGGNGSGQVKSSRGVPGAKKHDEPAGVQNSKGSKTRKSDAESIDVEKGDQVETKQAPQTQAMQKSIVGVRGTEFVQYVDYGDAPGSDAFIAKSIAEAQGALGQQATQPMDLNNDLSRLLV